MKREVSAGGIVFRKKGKIHQILLIKDKNDNWTFPKGLIESNEKTLSAAKREIKEEVGLTSIKMTTPLSPINYWYKWEKDIIRKTVYYFLFEYIGSEKPEPQKDEGIQEIKWVSLDKAKQIVGYPETNKPVINEVINKLKVKNQKLKVQVKS